MRIDIVAKTGGIKVDGVWYNPANDEIKQRVLSAKEYMVGKDFNMVLDKSNRYTDINLAGRSDYDEYVEEDNDIEAENQLDKKINTNFTGVKLEKTEVKKPEIKKPENNYFTNLNKVSCKVEKKAGLNYISWAESWAKLKEIHPEAQYEIYCNENGLPYFRDECGVFAKVGVYVNDIEHIMVLPVLNHLNKPVEKPDAFLINKTIMRCLAKSIAMHGLGTYVFLGEDYPVTED